MMRHQGGLSEESQAPVCDTLCSDGGTLSLGVGAATVCSTEDAQMHACNTTNTLQPSQENVRYAYENHNSNSIIRVRVALQKKAHQRGDCRG